MKKYYRNMFGCTASITEHRNGTATLVIRIPDGRLDSRTTYATFRGARIALGMTGPTWTEQKGDRT